MGSLAIETESSDEKIRIKNIASIKGLKPIFVNTKGTSSKLYDKSWIYVGVYKDVTVIDENEHIFNIMGKQIN